MNATNQAQANAAVYLVLVLTAGEFSYGIYLLLHGDWLVLYLAMKYTLAEKWSPVAYFESHLKRACWKHIPHNQCIPRT
jgi:hypothetical protein